MNKVDQVVVYFEGRPMAVAITRENNVRKVYPLINDHGMVNYARLQRAQHTEAARIDNNWIGAAAITTYKKRR